VNLYDNAEETYEVAKLLFKSGMYRVSIANACLAIELYLKSRMYLTEEKDKYEGSHDVINIYQCLTKRFRSKKDLRHIVKLSRKYFNEARYPRDKSVFTEDFAREFIGYAADVKDYIDNECIAGEDDLINTFTVN
jgi:HEPN domain-containing protein